MNPAPANMVTPGIKNSFLQYIKELQQSIIQALEEVDGKGKFIEDEWKREEGGGGLTCVMENGNIFEKAGVNFSAVHGELPPSLKETLSITGTSFFACGLSLVIHPLNPFIPTVHANWRYFELYDDQGSWKDCWIGGGSDLTPYYIFPEDGKHFHSTLKTVLDAFGENFYPLYKKQCDEYFVNRHRVQEARGIGGIFYDYIRPTPEKNAAWLLKFQQANGDAFLSTYLPIVMKRSGYKYTENEVRWQEIRRGRYVEFNLVHDRGTLFGLKTNGRTESILMSLPPRARWVYDYHAISGSKEAELLEYLKPRNWIE